MIIETTTEERRQETIQLYNKCKPYLDKGYSLHRAAWKVRGQKPNNTKNGWYKELIDYSISQGFDYYGTLWNRVSKRNSVVVERSSEEIENETVELFNTCKPYLDKGMGFYETLKLVKNLPTTGGIGARSWYKRFREYAASQGYYPTRGKRV